VTRNPAVELFLVTPGPEGRPCQIRRASSSNESPWLRRLLQGRFSGGCIGSAPLRLPGSPRLRRAARAEHQRAARRRHRVQIPVGQCSDWMWQDGRSGHGMAVESDPAGSTRLAASSRVLPADADARRTAARQDLQPELCPQPGRHHAGAKSSVRARANCRCGSCSKAGGPGW
jgi:hypothetical protein